MLAGQFGAGLINIFVFGSHSDSLLPMHTAAKEDGQPFAELNKQINKVKWTFGNIIKEEMSLALLISHINQDIPLKVLSIETLVSFTSIFFFLLRFSSKARVWPISDVSLPSVRGICGPQYNHVTTAGMKGDDTRPKIYDGNRIPPVYSSDINLNGVGIWPREADCPPYHGLWESVESWDSHFCARATIVHYAK